MTPTEYTYETDDEESGEDAPFLSNPGPASSRSSKHFIHQTSSPRAIILLLFLIIFTLSFAGHLMGLPVVRIYEDIICHHYYEKNAVAGGNINDIDESMCKGEQVQNQLNILLAVLHFLGAIPGLVMTVPYGLLADRMGRRPVFLLSVFGMIISGVFNMFVMYFWKTLPLRLVWLCPLFTLIGGGEAVCGMMFYAIGSDITTDANRSNIFLFGASASFVAELVSPSVMSFLMNRWGPWVPLSTGMFVLALGMVPAFFIAETLHLRRSSTSPDYLTPETESGEADPHGKASTYFTSLKRQMVDGVKRIHDSTTVLRSLPIFLLLVPFITTPFGRQSIDLSLRYISKRFGWKLSQTAVLLSLRALINILLLLAILPGISYYLTECRHFSSNQKDLIIAQFSAALLVIGSLLMAASPDIGLTIVGLAIVTLGTGFVSMVRSLITTLVDKEHVARLYAAIAVVETSTALAASPALAGMYALGLKWKGPWLGLPFFGVAVICLIAGIGVLCFGFLKQPKEEMPYGDEDRETLIGNTLPLEEDGPDALLIDVV